MTEIFRDEKILEFTLNEQAEENQQQEVVCLEDADQLPAATRIGGLTRREMLFLVFGSAFSIFALLNPHSVQLYLQIPIYFMFLLINNIWYVITNFSALYSADVGSQSRAYLSIALMKTSWPALLFSLIFGYVALQLNRQTKKQRIAFNDNQLGIGRSRNPMTEQVIKWSDLKSVEIQKSKHLFGTSHVMKLTTTKNKVVSIKWQHVSDSVDPGSLINALQTHAPRALKHLEVPNERQAAFSERSESYTKLWFKYHSVGTERKRTSELLTDDTLKDGQYKIVSTVGGGGQGTAYLATDTNDSSKQIVLKEYILPLHRGNQVLQDTIIKLEHEADLLRSINHNQIVTLRDCFIEDYRGYLVMEYIEGRTLKQIVDEDGPQSEAVVRGFALQACEIVSYLHCMEPSVIHRDLTPDNFILQSNGLLKLVDFNVAHQLESQATATVVGKHCYIPPEQFRGKPTIQSDIYALGGTLHFLLTGCEPEPITVSHPKQIAASISEQRGNAISDKLDAIIAKATATDTKKRYADAAELAKDLAGS